jgi:chromosome segregation ATPase
MISDMIAKLEQEAADDADHNAYCEQEMTKTATKKEEHSSKIEALSTKIDQMSARSAKAKKHVVELQSQLAAIAEAQAKLDKIRTEENAEYLSEKEELDKGLKGVQVALGALKDYYGKDDKSHKTRVRQSDAIISLLETIEGDFSKTLAELMAAEQSAVTEYETETQDNQVAKSKKTVAVEAKTKVFTSLDKAVSDSQSDKNSIQTELDAVVNCLSKLKKECVMKKDTLEEQMQKRQVEIAGLKEALDILEKETALLQVHRSLRQRKQQFLG